MLLADRDLETTSTAPAFSQRDRLLAQSLCAQHGWPIIDVTRRSIEETAATIIKLLHDRQTGVSDGEGNGA